ncbi:acetyl-CoA carboxylase biotin carboxyl carrier protein [Pseudanabaenaceae cyanobacterium LEGE 13415]|nr:acetyl-CoA carboxylase biotin carboxyl carrier protein [Pseudanabaenaceae cyanobacterium LEGE 13415]
MPLDLTELRELLTTLNQTDISELTLKADDFELTVRRGARVEMAPVAAAPVPQPTIAPPPEPVKPEAPSAAPSNDRKLADVVSPIVGTFYRSPSPDEPPFVDVGNRIQKGQVVCIIEAMKVMNEIEAEVSGEIVEILVQNGQPVEYGQPLMRVNPS